MGIKFQDYYETLGVERKASQEEIQKAFRKLARKFHPDVNKERTAEAKFKQINEAYEVLKDPEKRKKYDVLGANYHAGQDFEPPPGFDFGGMKFRRAGDGASQGFGGLGDFSDFFEAIFGGGASRGGGAFGAQFGGSGPFGQPHKGEDQQAEIELSLEDIFHGGSKQVSFEQVVYDAHGVPRRELKKLKVKIPKGIKDGSVIRLSGQGAPGGAAGVAAGDLLLRVRLARHPNYKVEGDNLVLAVPVSPWEATLGGQVTVRTLAGELRVTIPSGSQSGQRLRVRGKGLVGSSGNSGDLYLELSIAVPGALSAKERELMEQLKEVSSFNPRG
jgi:curved DNA-binding protein